MSKISDSEHEALLLKESKAASEKKRKLEEDIRIADARNNLLLETAAQKDIEAYKKRSLPVGSTIPTAWGVFSE